MFGRDDVQGDPPDRLPAGSAGTGSRAPQRKPGWGKAQLLTTRASRRQVRRTIVAAAVFTVGLAGCGGSNGGEEPNGRPAAPPSATASLAASGDTSGRGTIDARQPAAVAASAIPAPAAGGATHSAPARGSIGTGSVGAGSVGAGTPVRRAAATQPARIPPSPIPAGSGGAAPPPAAAAAGTPQGISRTFYGANSPGENLPQRTAGPNANSGGPGLVVTYPPASPFVVPQCHKPERCHGDSERQPTPAPSSPTGATTR